MTQNSDPTGRPTPPAPALPTEPPQHIIDLPPAVPPADPQCKNCRFWLPRKAGAAGDCQLFSDDPNIAQEHRWKQLIDPPTPLAFVAPFAGADGGGLITEPDFWCIQFQPRAAPPSSPDQEP